MNAKIYSAYNHMQKNDAKCILKELGDSFNWKEKEYILDIGSGPGDVTANVIRPFVSKNSIIVGSDISEEMVNFANKRYASDKLKFKKLDIQDYSIWDTWNKASFDKIFSFYCLHWIKDIRQASINIHTLLKPEGEILLVMLPANPVHVLFKIMSSIPKWSSYMQDIDIRSPLQFSTQPAKEFKEILKSVNFTDVRVMQKRCKFTYPSKESLIKAVQAVTPPLTKIPSILNAEFLNDLQNLIPNSNLVEMKEDGTCEVQYVLIIAKAKKNKL